MTYTQAFVGMFKAVNSVVLILDPPGFAAMHNLSVTPLYTAYLYMHVHRALKLSRSVRIGNILPRPRLMTVV